MILALDLPVLEYFMPSCNISLDGVDPYRFQCKRFATAASDSFSSSGDLRSDASSTLP